MERALRGYSRRPYLIAVVVTFLVAAVLALAGAIDEGINPPQRHRDTETQRKDGESPRSISVSLYY